MGPERSSNDKWILKKSHNSMKYVRILTYIVFLWNGSYALGWKEDKAISKIDFIFHYSFQKISIFLKNNNFLERILLCVDK